MQRKPGGAAWRSNAASDSSDLLRSAPEARRGGFRSVVRFLALQVFPEGGVSASSLPSVVLVVAGPASCGNSRKNWTGTSL